MDRHYAILFAVLGASLVLSLNPFPCYSWDGYVYMQHAAIIAGKPNNYDEFYLRAPMLPLLISPAMKISGLAGSLMSNFISWLSIPLIYLVGKKLYGRDAGLASAIILSLSFPALELRRDVMTHMPAISLMLLAFLLPDGLKGLFAGLSMLTRFSLGIYFPSVLRESRKKILDCLMFLIPLAVFLLWCYVILDDPFIVFKHLSLVASRPFQALPEFVYSSLAMFSPAMLIGLVVAIKKDPKDFLIPLLIMHLSLLLISTHKEGRYIADTYLPVVLLAGKGLSGLSRNEKGLALLLILSFIQPYWLFIPGCNNPAIRAAKAVNEINETEICLHFRFAEMAYLTDAKIFALPQNKLPENCTYVYFPEQINHGYPEVDCKNIIKSGNGWSICRLVSKDLQHNSLGSPLQPVVGYALYYKRVSL